ncbi:MAG: regulatory signaling modulator protein AmpE [Sulfuricellaceae bacterium]|nr:regulatory signaling modulator protein AmpE [Sulfuricellaceae bacterium]
MTFFCLLTALLLEFFYPLPAGSRVTQWFSRYTSFLERNLNAGHGRHSLLVWGLSVLPFVLATLLVTFLLARLGVLVEWVWGVAVLYLCMGFMDTAGKAASIAALLRNQEQEKARQQFELWTGVAATHLSDAEICNQGIQKTLLGAYQYLFGAMIWFVLLGPTGAVLYRLAQSVKDEWTQDDQPDTGAMGSVASSIFYWLEWLPLRVSATSFAMVGNFEDAMYCWRTQADRSPGKGLQLVLASGAGAMGVKLTGENGQELGQGAEADADFLESSTNLIWRTLLMWLGMLFLLMLMQWF